MSKVRKVAAVVTLGKVDRRDADKRAARNSKLALRELKKISAALPARQEVEDYDEPDTRAERSLLKFEREVKSANSAHRNGWLTDVEYDASISSLMNKHSVDSSEIAPGLLLRPAIDSVGIPSSRIATSSSLVDDLTSLRDLHSSGALTDAEYDLAKARLLH